VGEVHLFQERTRRRGYWENLKDTALKPIQKQVAERSEGQDPNPPTNENLPKLTTINKKGAKMEIRERTSREAFCNDGYLDLYRTRIQQESAGDFRTEGE